MSLHKLLAGSGYTYLTRQVAANDAAESGYPSLSEYYSERGEAPGRWLGRGLAGLEYGPVAGERVTEAQMVALFGHGHHPNADAIEQAAGQPRPEVTRLGARFTVSETNTAFRRDLAGRITRHNLDTGAAANTVVSDEVRAAIRSELGREWFERDNGRLPQDRRELSDFITRVTRPGETSVAGYDLTFSPVKSISTLWALASPEIAAEIESAHEEAVRDVVAWLEDTAVFTRLGHNGVRQVDVTGLVAVAFMHRDSRAGDPDLHTHVAISNKVQTLAGAWRALDGRVLYKATVAASERYNTRLEVQLIARLGVRFADRPGAAADKEPVREIVGVDPSLNVFWSSRREAITVRQAALAADFARQHGRDPDVAEARRLYQQANLETRQGKHAPRAESEQRRTWRTEAAGVLGGDAAVVDMLAVAVPGRGRNVAVGDSRLTERWAELAARDAIVRVEARRATWQSNHVRAEVERMARGGGVPASEIDAAVEAATRLALSPEHSVCLGVADRLDEPAALRRRDGSSVFSVAGTQLYSSAAILDAEARLLAAASLRDGRRVVGGTVELALLGATAVGLQLSDAQATMIRDLAYSGARLQLAIAPAGAGKTTALGVLANAWVDAGGTVIGLAPSATAAAELRATIGGRTDTVAKLLHSLGTQQPPGWVESIDERTLLIVDESGAASTRDLDQVVTFALERGASVRLVGDDHQLTARQSGGVLRDIAATTGAVTLDTVVRFDDPVEGHASLALRTGDPIALGYYLDHDRIHGGDHGTVVEQAYAAWRADHATGLDALLLAPTNAVVRELNLRARADRLATVRKHGAEVVLHDGTPASAGDTIVTRRNNRRLPITSTDWVKNGDRWHVDAARPNGDLEVTHLETRRHITLPGRYVERHVELGYATTVYLAQGRTADTAHAVFSGRETRETLYVAMTRGRSANHVYLDTAATGEPHAATTPDAIVPPTSVDRLLRMLAHEGARPSATGQQRLDLDPEVRLRDAIGRYVAAVEASGGATVDCPGPLPWLPAVSDVGDSWTDYLSARADLVLDLADQVGDVSRLPNASWAGPLTASAPDLAREVIVWRTSNAIPNEDLRPCGPPSLDNPSYRAALLARVTAVVDPTGTPTDRWRPTADSIDPRLADSPYWPTLANAFSRAAASGYDLEANLPRLSAHPLPDQRVGAELFYRLAADCPAAMAPPVLPPHPAMEDDAVTRMRRSAQVARHHPQPTAARGGPRR